MIPSRPKSCLSRVKRSSVEAETDAKAENLDVLAAADKAPNLLVEHEKKSKGVTTATATATPFVTRLAKCHIVTRQTCETVTAMRQHQTLVQD